jgi:hypothetical protein
MAATPPFEVTAMNASAPARTLEDKVRSRIRAVAAFSRGARVVCAAFTGFGLVGVAFILITSLLGVAFPGLYGGPGFTPQQKMWGLCMLVVTYGVLIPISYQLYRLFSHLAAGAIFTPENVRRVRHVGLLWLMWTMLGILVPFAEAALVGIGFIDPLPARAEYAFSMAGTLSSFIAAALILLVAWIIDVGLYEKDQAEALQREAELVI